MGLDTSHNAWHGAYSAFSRWRDHVAVCAGYKLVDAEDGLFKYKSVDLPWDMFEQANYMGEWANGPVVEDPLLYLIVHSDCDGVIHPSEGIHIAARLEQILPSITEEGAGGHIHSMREKTQQFIDGLRAAAALNEDVVFA